MNAPILITGSGGQLGTALVQIIQNAVTVDVEELDITSPAQVREVLQQTRPKIVINTAAYTAVDKAEDEPTKCFEVNHKAVEYLATETKSLPAKLIQISTDYVFGGPLRNRIPHTETDSPNPLGIYAQSKWNGEKAASINPNHIVIRTCGLYGHPGPTAAGNFVTTMIRMGRERNQLKVVNDQHCTPTSVAELAEAVKYLAESEETGLFHITNGGETTWHEFARAIFDVANIDCDVKPITTDEFGAKAPRPGYSVLDCSKFHATGGPRMSDWQDAIRNYVAQIL